MARPPAKELTERELEVMHVFWKRGNSTVAEVRDALKEAGLDRAYTTVATLVRILADKGFLDQTNQERPFSFEPRRSYQDVSKKLLGELIDRVFHGSREQLLVRLLEQKSLTRPSAPCCKTSCARRRNEIERPRIDASGKHRPRDGLCLPRNALLPGAAAFEPGGRRLAAASSLLFMAIVSAVVSRPGRFGGHIASADARGCRSHRLSTKLEPAKRRRQFQLPSRMPRRRRAACSRPADSSSQPRESTSAVFRRSFSVPFATARMAPPQSSWGWPFWLALGFFASACAGFARLGLGVLAVARLRAEVARSTTPALDEEIQLLRAELSCTRQDRGARDVRAGDARDPGMAAPAVAAAVRLARLESGRAARVSSPMSSRTSFVATF